MAGRLRSRSRSAGFALFLMGAGLAGCATGSNSPLASATPLEQEFAGAAVTWDLDKDGSVTCAEWQQYVAGLFRESDANRDGVLTRQEFATLARTDRLFETAGINYFDANADGRLTLAEMADKPNPAFLLLDKNGDCVISADERVQPRSVWREEAKSQGATPPSGRRRQ